MTQSEVELIDGDYGLVRKDRISSNQIKTKPISFSTISDNWRKFRLKLYNEKLEEEKKSVLTQNFNVDDNSRLTEKSIDSINSKSLIIARLEEKIRILSKESVPSNYVDNRAIKLRTKMMNNLVYNSSNAYSIGLDKMDVVFENSDSNVLGTDNTNSNIDSPIEININNDNNQDENIALDTETVLASESLNTSEVQPEAVTDSSEIENDNNLNNEVTDINPVDEVHVAEINDSEIAQIENQNDEVSLNTGVEDNESNIADIEPVLISSDIGNDSSDMIEKTEELPVINVNDEPASTSDNVIVVSSNDDSNAIANDIISQINFEDKSDDSNLVDDDQPALFEIINPDEENKIETSIDNNILFDNEIGKVSKNGSSIARVDKYKDEVGKFEYQPESYEENQEQSRVGDFSKTEDIYSSTKKKVSFEPFKNITFKDLFKNAKDLDNYTDKNVNDVSSSISQDRYVPLIVPERNEGMTNVVTNNFDNVDTLNIQDIKNQYYQLQQLLKSKTARLKSVKATYDDVKRNVAESSHSVDEANANLQSTYNLFAQQVDSLRQQCAAVDQETASNESEIDSGRETIARNLETVQSTNEARRELEMLLNGDNYSSYEDDTYHIKVA